MAIEKYPGTLPEREFIGYGLKKPDPKWPGGAKICVNFLVNYWVGSETNPEQGDKTHEILHLDLPPAATGPLRNDMNEAQYEYGGREGLPRILKLFAKYKIPVTWNVATQALEIAPYWVKPLLESGGEITCGSYRYVDYVRTDPAVEEEYINKAIDGLQKLTGDKALPKAWFVDRASADTQRLYCRAHDARDLPLLYTSDSSADELPFWMPNPLKSEGKADKGLLVIPMQFDTTDMKFCVRGAGFGSPKLFYEYMVDTFDVLYEEGQEGEPKMMTLTLHPHIIGHPSRAYYLEEFLKYITSKEGVWIATREEIANHWIKTFPYDPKTAFCQTTQIPCAAV